MSLGEKLSKLRKERGLTQKDVSYSLEVSSGAVGMWETDKRQPDIDTLIRLSYYYDVTVDYLVKNSEDTSVPRSLNPHLSDREQDLITSFRKLTSDNQDIIMGDIKRYIKEQRLEETQAVKEKSIVS